MPPAGFEPAFSAGERLQTHALDRYSSVRLEYKMTYDEEKLLKSHLNSLTLWDNFLMSEVNGGGGDDGDGCCNNNGNDITLRG
jgi:hypothetical protein